MNDNPTKSFTHLLAWQAGHKLVVDIYKTTDKFPHKEIFSLTDQIRRATTSITSNIAEGYSRRSTKEKIQYYYQALGSLTEAQNQLLIARDVGYITKTDFNTLANQTILTSKLLNGLIKSIKKSL